MRRHVGGHQQNDIEPEPAARCAGGIQMPAVDWIEGSAENANAFGHSFDVSCLDVLASTAAHMASSSADRPAPVAAETA